MDIWGRGEGSVEKRKDSVYLFDNDRDVAVAPETGNIPAIGHVLQHSRGMLGGMAYCGVMKLKKKL